MTTAPLFRLSGLPVGISYSMGKSSKWQIWAVIMGLLPRPEHIAVFQADTGDEHDWSYEDAIGVHEMCRSAGIPYFECRDKETLSGHMIQVVQSGVTRADQPPLWIDKGLSRGRVQNRCTLRFKVAPMRRAQGEWLASLGLPKRMEKWIGFGHDERRRVKPNDVAWERLRFPAIELNRTREQMTDDLKRWKTTCPPFSMCVHCPHKNIMRLMETPANNYKTASEYDEAIRDLDTIGLTDGAAYVSQTLVPLKNKERLIQIGRSQPMLPGFEPNCDGGHCFL